jgi:hypothetical protein
MVGYSDIGPKRAIWDTSSADTMISQNRTSCELGGKPE